jgi:hypothetical protein
MEINMKMFFAMFVTMGSVVAQAQVLATYSGSVQKVIEGELLVGAGVWKSVPSQCAPYITKQSQGFSASVTASVGQADIKCEQAEITLDLEKSSFCQDQGGMEVYFPPTIVAVKCY